jgi:hypothetical protein
VIPTFLIATTSNWVTTARLGVSLSRAGGHVESICPAGQLIRKTRALRKAYPYNALSPLRSFREAILSARPDLIVSADDLSTQHLLDLYAQEQQQENGDVTICELIERSLGSPKSFPFMMARASFMKIAQEEGIRIPKTTVIRNTNDLKAWVSKMGFPVVLKADGSSSGEGTKVVRTFGEAERALRSLQHPLHLVRVVKRVLVNQDLRSLRPKLQGRRAVVNAQKFIAGRDATSLVACWEGVVLGGLHFEVINKQYTYGPASVMRLIENPEIESAIVKTVRRLMLSGLHGFDFLLEDQTELPHMIEFNPRSTQVGHLTLGTGRDLPGALYAALTRKPAREAPKVTDNPTIALFPQEWLRDPDSIFLKTGFHDIPWEEPELIRASLRNTKRRWPTWQSVEKWIRIFSTNRCSLL